MHSMINLTRRKRQAHQNIGPLILAVYNKTNGSHQLNPKQAQINSIGDLENLIAEFEPGVLSLAQSLQPDWAIPIVLEAIGELYYGKYSEYKHCGNYFKRSIAYLWQNSLRPHGNFKNMARLELLICQCYILETLYSFLKMFVAIPDFYFFFRYGHTIVPEEFRQSFMTFGRLISGRGKRLRIAEVNSMLMLKKCTEYFPGLLSVLDGTPPSNVNVFKNTFYEKIPGVESKECSIFWKEIFFRYCMYLATLANSDDENGPTAVSLFHEFGIEGIDSYITQEIVINSFWTTAWFKCQIAERYGNLIVEKPIVRISPDGDFATSAVLLGDSINLFIEKQIFGYSSRSPYIILPKEIFQNAFSRSFEDKCIELLRSHGFVAGHVQETGIWKCQEEDITLSFHDEKLYGEIDVFAHHSQAACSLLIECKVLLDVEDSRSYRNILAKLKDDSEGFRYKLCKKSSWLKNAFIHHFNKSIDPIMCLVTDIPLPVLNTNNRDVFLMDYTRLQHFLNEYFAE